MHRTRRALAALSTAAVLLLVSGSCTTDPGSEEAFCDQVGEVPTMGVLLAGFADADPVELERRLDAGATAYEGLRDEAPEQIRGRVSEVVDLVTAMIDAVRANPDDPDALAADLRAAVAEQPEIEQAATEVEAYARTTCGVELDPEAVPTSGG